jgi:Flp pilus assembly protein CpaB
MSRSGRIILSVGLGLLAALFGMLYLSSQRDELLGGTQMIRVYVAATNIRPNIPLERSMFVVREVPRSYVQPQAITVTEVPDPENIQGVALVPIQAGEQVLRSKLFDGVVPPLSAELQQRRGMVGVGVSIADLPNALHGMLRAGDRVDVLASFEFERARDDRFTEVRPLYQNVEVLAVNERSAGVDAAQPATGVGQTERVSAAELVRTVTLSLPPVAAQQIVLTQQLGSIWLLLRATGDTTEYQYETWNNERLLQSPHRLWRARGQEEMFAEMMRR